MSTTDRSAKAKSIATADALDPRSFQSPVDFLAAEHERQLAICDLLDHLAHNPRHAAASGELTQVRDYLVHELPLHTEDEEQDLFPVLAERCPKTDNVQEIFGLLRREHDTDKVLIDELVANLDALIGGQALADPSAFMANALAVSEAERRHLAWENAVVLPRALRHLTAEDCAALTRAMAARRGNRPKG
jgi:hemerythrin-like domain-containing protein